MLNLTLREFIVDYNGDIATFLQVQARRKQEDLERVNETLRRSKRKYAAPSPFLLTLKKKYTCSQGRGGSSSTHAFILCCWHMARTLARLAVVADDSCWSVKDA